MNLKSLLTHRIFRLSLAIIIFAGLASQVQRSKILGARVEAIGNLVFTYPNSPGGPIFQVSNFLPGDCVTKTVTVENNGPDLAKISVRSDQETDLDQLSTQLSIIISENNFDLYGGTATSGAKLVSDFFSESNPEGIKLSNLANLQTTNYDFEVCFNTTAGNEFQNTQTTFDLVFGEIIVPIDLPEQCSHLEGIVTQQIDGTPGNDNIRGTGASELIRGFDGNDRIQGGGGHDCIVGGLGDDRIDGGTGEDTIIAGEGNDRVNNSTDPDKIYGGPGNDRLEGGSGDDYIEAGTGNDTVDGGSDNDLIYGQEGNDNIRGGRGEDEIYGQEGDDIIRGESDNDTIYGGIDNDSLRGGSGDDTLDGENGTDTLQGNSGTDTCLNGETLSSCEL